MRFDGTLCSGDPYTTLTNTLRTLCYMAYYTRHLDIPKFPFAAGDDGVVMSA